MTAYLQNLVIWDWLAFAVLLLIVEVFGTAGYFLWFGTAAALVGVLLLAFPELSIGLAIYRFCCAIFSDCIDLVASFAQAAGCCAAFKSAR